MPSFRVTVTIGALLAGVEPESVLPFAADAAARSAVVEASDLAVVRGAARVIIRFTADDVAAGWLVGTDVVDRLATIAETTAWAVAVRDGGRWYPVAAPGSDIGSDSGAAESTP